MLERIAARKQSHNIVTAALLTNMHGKRPTAAVLRNHFAGVAAVVNDTGLIRQAKADPQHGHIDGSVAAAMAVGRLALGATSQSAYNAPGAGGLYVF